MTSRSGFLPAPIRVTLNDPEFPIQLKVRFADGTVDEPRLWLSELTIRDWMNMGFNCEEQKKRPMNCKFWDKGLYEFSRCFTAEGATNWSGAAKIGNFSHYVASFYAKTRQHSYRKEDRAMRPIYGCREKFSESSLRTRLLFQKFVMDFCSDRY